MTGDETISVEPVGFWTRAAASLVDSALVAVIGVAGVIAVSFLWLSTPEVDLLWALLLVFLAFGFPFLYYLYFEGSNGRTPGKMLVGTRVVDAETGGGIGYGRAAIRTLVKLVSGLALGLGYLWMLWDPRRQTWHDKAASTLVVRADASPATVSGRDPTVPRASSSKALLSVRDVTLRFGGIVALDGVSFDVEEGHISGLIGPNGAGKTTAFNVITRLYKPDVGKVDLDGSSILRTAPHRMVHKGIARTFQNIQLFRTMSVLENVLVGAHGRGRKAGTAEAYEVLEVVGLKGRAHFPAAALPYGTQKRVELARALVAKPRLLLLDEPAGGLNHEEVAELGTFIRRLRDDFDLTILLVEHHMNLVMSISDHVNVLSFGRKIADGTPAEVQANPAVIEAYLGSDDESDDEGSGLSQTPDGEAATNGEAPADDEATEE